MRKASSGIGAKIQRGSPARDALRKTYKSQNMNFFETIKEIVPWMTPREASEKLNRFEVELFNRHPEYLELSEKSQNAIVIREFRKSPYAQRTVH